MAIISICMGVFCHGYIMGFSISKYDRIDSYAETSTVTDDDVVESFKAYCRSRNLIIDSSVLGASVSWTGSMLRNAMSAIGVDMDTIQANLSKEVGGNLGIRWLLTATGMNIYNRLFAELLQRESLTVGDENVDKTVYSGKTYTDSQGNKCLVYVLKSGSSNNPGATDTANVDGKILKFGSPYIFTSEQLVDLYNSNGDYYFPNPSVNVSGNASFKVNQGDSTNHAIYIRAGTSALTAIAVVSNKDNFQHTARGHFGIFLNGDKYYLGGYFYQNINNSSHIIKYKYFTGPQITPVETPDDTDVTISTPPDKKILPDPPENPTTIYPGGGTGDNPDQPGGDPDNWNPTTPTIPDPSSPSFPSVDLPDIDIPDLPSLNFSLGDLRNKFPFSLPFDIIAVLNVLDGEPQAPHIEATVPIGRWYTWEMDFDFSEFDNYARIFRAFEFIGFCIGLAIFTVHFVKG